MKSDHRHELKTNELAEWLSNLPQWARENSITLICLSVLIIGIAAFYVWRSSVKRGELQQQVELSNLIGQLFDIRTRIYRAQTEGRDLSFMLLGSADNLRTFAKKTDNDQMAAFALIKRAEALRMELHYRQGKVSVQVAVAQINAAKAGYIEALERCPTNPSLAALAKFGIGLCDEELGDFKAAEQIYRDITTNADYSGTIAAAQAELRLKIMDDYKQKIVLKPAPVKPIVDFTTSVDAGFPLVELPVEANLSAEVNSPLDFGVKPEELDFIPDLNDFDGAAVVEE